jgi:hypothetical protein
MYNFYMGLNRLSLKSANAPANSIKSAQLSKATSSISSRNKGNL